MNVFMASVRLNRNAAVARMYIINNVFPCTEPKSNIIKRAHENLTRQTLAFVCVCTTNYVAFNIISYNSTSILSYFITYIYISLAAESYCIYC